MGATVTTNFNTPSQHSLVTNNNGNACAYLGSPYINNCNLEISNTVFSTIYGSTVNPAVAAIPANLITFD